MVAPASAAVAEARAAASGYAQRHLRFGWWSLLVFLTLGIGLEALQGFKVGFYLRTTNETRRLLWTLAHAHGTLLSLLHLLFGMYVSREPTWRGRSLQLASRCLFSASLLLPVGFFLGGLDVHGGDPGLGVLLVPVGAVALFVAVLAAARAAMNDEKSWR